MKLQARACKWLKMAVSMVLALLLSWGGALPCFAAEQKTVRVAVVDYPNYLMMHEDGSVTGYAYEYLMELQKRTGWRYEFIRMSFSDASGALTDGSIDLLPGNQYTAERAELWDYSARSIGEGGTVLCVLPGNNDYAYNDYAAYDGMRIGAMAGTVRIEQTKEKMARYGAEPEIVEYGTDTECKTALKAGEVEAILMSTIRCESNYKILARINSAPLYFCISRQRPELKSELDAAIEEIHLDDPYYEQRLDQKYYGNVLTQASLTREELAYAAASEPVTVAICTDMAPVEYYDGQAGEYRGIVPDSLELIAQYTGLTFRFVPREDVDTLNRQMADGEVQLIASAVYSPSLPSTLHATCTAPYYENGIALVTKKGSAVASGRMVLKSEDSLLQNTASARGYANITFADTFGACLDAVESGRAMFTLVPSNSVNHLLRHSYYADLEADTLPNSGCEFGLGVADSADSMLLSILNKAIASITDRQRTQLLVQNLDAGGAHEATLREFVSAHHTELLFSALIAAVLILLAVILNMLHIRRLNRQLRLEAARADKSSAAKSEFLSRMSHDMRTPLNAVLGFTQLAKDEPGLPEKAGAYLDQISTAGSYLLGLIGDVLDMAKIESGKWALHAECVNAPQLFSELAQTFRLQAAEKGITLVADFSGAQTPWLVFDALRMRQLYANLLSNAIKFSQSGTEIRWTMRQEPAAADAVHTVSSISDQGCGMSEAFMARMFEPFEQNQPEDAACGTGLGLPIVQTIVRLMGGSIRVQSTPGKGTTFTVELEQKLGAPPDEPARNRKPGFDALRKSRILLCEDNPINTVIAVKLLEAAGCCVECAENGRIGVEKLSASPPEYYDAVLMDIRMPEMDGLAAARAIRALGRPDTAALPIIAMSANAFEADVQKSLDAGMNEHLSKPIEREKLYAALERYIGPRK